MRVDRNFDDLFDRFQRQIKASTKGQLRSILIREDLEEILPGINKGPMKVLDAGCGFGDLSIYLAAKGHEIKAVDISAKMLEHTKNAAESAQLSHLIRTEQGSLQAALGEKSPESFGAYDLICIHSVLEWLAEPYAVLPLISPQLKAGGYLSLTIYNLHRAVFNSLVNGSFRKIRLGDYSGQKGLTPTQPIVPERIAAELIQLGFTIELQAGLRCFYDILPAKEKAERTLDDMLLLERRYRKLSPYRDIARYVHFIARWPG